jgi:voltage-gated sodium channel
MADILPQILPAPRAKREKYRFRLALRAALRSSVFESFLTGTIVFYALSLCALSYLRSVPGEYGAAVHVLEDLDRAIFQMFCAELMIKFYAFRRGFFRNGWNVFDAVVITISIIGMAASITAFRAVRVLRTLRLVKRVPSMRIVIESFMRALPGIGSVLTVMLLMVFVYALIGQSLYGQIAPELFGTIHQSAFTLFTVLTLEGWPDVSRAIMADVPLAWIYFVSFIAINSFTVLNLMIAVIIDAMQKEYDDHAEEEREDILHEIKALRREIAALSRKE